MKFLCPSCKAKYQIADDKVAGRSVRMKCRKCGKEIRVSSADAISSASEPPPQVEEVPAVDAASQVSAGVPEARAKPAPVRAPMKSVAGLTPLPGVSRPGVPGARPPPRPITTAAKPAALSRPLTRAVTATGSARNSEAQSPTPRAEGGRAKGALAAHAPAAHAPAKAPIANQTLPGRAAEVSVPKPLNEEYGDEEQTQIADTSALAGAFSKAVAAQQAHQVSDPLTMPGDEWFVGINGVPVGPIHLGELRSKAASGSITKESLVWRDGFEEWRPLKSFPELSAIVEESVSSAIASVLPPATESRPAGANLGALSDPFSRAAPMPTTSTPSGVTGAAVVTDDLDIAGLRPRRSGRAAWLAVVVALFFGICVGFVFFSRKPQEVVRYVEVPAKGAEPAPTPAANDARLPEPQTPSKETKPSSKGPLTATKTQPVGPKPEEQSKLTGGLRGLGAGVQGGPNTPAGTQATSVGSQLEAAQVQQVVSRYTSSVKRSCWQPALDTRDKDAPTSARVVVSIQVGPSGSVKDVSTSGDPRGYRGLANCIAGRVRGWQFPASGSTTPVNVPFVFVAQ